MKDLYLIQPNGWTTSWLLASKNTLNDRFICLGPKLIAGSKEVIPERDKGIEYHVSEVALSIWLTEKLFTTKDTEQLPEMTIIDKVVREKFGTWLIIEATDMETAEAAIGIAMATGSVGAIDKVQEVDGIITRYAKVSRIELAKPR